MNVTTILKDNKTFLHSMALIYIIIGVLVLTFFIVLCKIKCLKAPQERTPLIQSTKSLNRINSSPAILEHNKEIERAEKSLYPRLN